MEDNRLWRICDQCQGLTRVRVKATGLMKRCPGCAVCGVVATTHTARSAERADRAEQALRHLLRLWKANLTDGAAYLDKLADNDDWS